LAKPYLFISYSHGDAKALEDLALLKSRGISIWFDEGLKAGTNWRDQLAETIDNASGLIFFASEGSLASPYCKEEIDYALRRDKLVLTIFSEAVELTPGLNMALGARQAILRQGLSREDYVNQLVRASMLMTHPEEVEKQPSDRNSIAVMRFENLSSDPDNAYLADGIAEELLTGLSRIDGVSVASRSSSFAIKTSAVDVRQVGSQLKVAWVLEGSVRRSGQRIRVSARLSESAEGRVSWAENFDRELIDLFELQDDIAANVLTEVSSRFDRVVEKPQLDFGTESIDAYNAYLQGRHESLKFTGKACDLAVSHLRRAIQLDPEFLRARLSLITSLESLRVILGRQGLDDVIKQERDLLRALDPAGKIVNWEAADKIASDNFGSILDAIEKILTGVLRYPDDPPSGGASSDRWWAGGFSVDDGVSGKIDPFAQYGLLLAGAGLYQTAEVYMHSAEHESTALVNIQIIGGKFDEARVTVERYIESNPQVIIHYFTYMIILDHLGEHDLADTQYNKIVSTVDGGLAQVAQILRAYWRDNTESLEQYLEGIDEAVVPYMFRGLCQVANDMDKAMIHFRASFEAREPFVIAMRLWIPSNVKPKDWAALLMRDDMQALIREAGVGPDWQNELRNRAMMLAPVTGIEVLEGEF
tara:strand:- start:466 stop:2403 length:1938 start_codon:yes stop_codon:yes gene_type:complete